MPPIPNRLRGVHVALIACAAGLAGVQGHAATLAERVKEMHCTSRAEQVEGTMLYKCQTSSGTSYFSAEPGATPPSTPSTPRASPSGNGNRVVPVPAPRSAASGFPRVDAETQRGRDDVRRRVLQDELAAEEKLLAEARGAYADGAPAPLPEEKADANKYRERIARLRQAVALHERNIDALRKELGGLK